MSLRKLFLERWFAHRQPTGNMHLGFTSKILITAIRRSGRHVCIEYLLANAKNHTTSKLAVNIIDGWSFIDENAAILSPKLEKLVQYSSKLVSILSVKTSNANVDVGMATASEEGPISVTSNKTLVEQCVAKKAWLEPRELGAV